MIGSFWVLKLLFGQSSPTIQASITLEPSRLLGIVCYNGRKSGQGVCTRWWLVVVLAEKEPMQLKDPTQHSESHVDESLGSAFHVTL